MKKTLICAVAILISIIGFSQTVPTLPNDPATKTGQLENGLTYYIRHNDKPAQRAEFYLATNVGAIQETPEQDGLAHFLEHMCFNGTKNFPGKGIINFLEGIGASFGGNVNAATGIEQTIYMLTNIPLVRPTVADSCILILHDYSHFVTCDPGEIDAERGVIIEEKRTRNTASWRNFIESNKYIFRGTPYAEETLIGSEEQLRNFKYHNLTDFYHTWYRPDLQAVIVVGDIDVDATEASIKKIFSDIPAAVNPKAKDVITMVPNKEPIVGIITDPETSSSGINILWKSEPRDKAMNNTPVYLMQDAVETIIYYAMEERFQEIISKPDSKFIGALLASGAYNNAMDAVIGQVSFKDGEAIPAFRAFMTEVEKLRRYGLSDGEVERAKARILADAESSAKKAGTRKNNEFVQPMIDNFFENKAFMDPETEFNMYSQILPVLKTKHINKVTSEIITGDNIVIVYSGPAKQGIKAPTEEELISVLKEMETARIERPAGEDIPTELLNASALKGSKVAKRENHIYGSEMVSLANGVKLILYPTGIEKDRIVIELFKKGGKSLLSDEEVISFDENIYGLFNSNSGVSSFSSTVLNKMLSGKKVSATPYVNKYTHGINISSTTKDIETALQLGYLIFTDSRFDPEEYNTGIKQLEAILPNLENNPSYKFQKAIKETLYAGERGRMFINREMIAKADIKTIESVHKRLFKDAAGTTVVIAGDFDKEQMIRLAAKYFGSIKKGGSATDWSYRGDGFVSESKYADFKTKMEAPKTSVLQLYKVDKPYSPDADVAYDALSYILDMVYVSTLREEEGGTYGAGTATAVKNRPEECRILQVHFDTNDGQSGKLRELARKGVKDIAGNGPTEEQFSKTVKNLEKNIPENRLRVNYWKNALVNYSLYGIDQDSGYEKAVKSLSPEKIKAAAEELINEGYFSEVIMRGE